ncbi:MAG: hypothetical protein FJ014_02010 [Chloroflexi bacterium]|nr:hypothetical protein [Chloroflexota bacterium]
MLGKAIGVARMRSPASGRILTITIDHAPSYGVLEGLEDIRGVVDCVAVAGPDAVVMMMMKGVAERCFPENGSVVSRKGRPCLLRA